MTQPTGIGSAASGVAPLSIYIHIPYCSAICAYCDFNVYKAFRRPEDRYVAALAKEVRHTAAEEWWREREVQSVYLGGGTPSLFRCDSIGRVLSAIRELWPLRAGAEITLEANPEDRDPEKLGRFRELGINRLSLGVQSFSAPALKRLTRHHSAEDSLQVLAAARAAGFTNINVDLIFAIPGQTLDEWNADLETLCRLVPEHASAYNLTYEEGTPLHRWRSSGRVTPLGEESEEAMFTRASEVLAAAGYEHYEISNYARPGMHARHNSNYWNGGEYLGIGAGAHSYRRRNWGERWSNERRPESYMAAIEERGQALVFSEELRRDQAMGEFVFLALRQRRGLSVRDFAERFGADLLSEFPGVLDLCAQELVARTESGYALTDRGRLVADTVFAEFF